jgi:hypothetical protein
MNPSEETIRARHGDGVLELCGEEAAALGSRALVVSSHHAEPREVQAMEILSRVLRRARVGHHPFPHVPRPGSAMDGCVDLAAEAARESRCRLVIGLGCREPLNAAREAAGRALLPSVLLPTSVGYGDPRRSEHRPLPDVLLADSRLSLGSPPAVTSAQGLELFAALLERYASMPQESDESLRRAMSLLVDSLPAAVAQPQDPGHRAALAEATARTVELLAVADPRYPPMKEMLRRLAPEGDVGVALLAGWIPALLEAGSEERGPLPRAMVARFGREILGVREEDDGRAATWAAGGIRQWILNLGMQPALTGGPATRARADEQLRSVLATALREK